MALSPVSADELEQRARERADMVDSQFCTSAEFQRFLEEAWQELYSFMVASGEDLFIRRARISGSAVDPLVTESGDLLVTENGDVIIVGGVVESSSYLNLPGQVKGFRLARHTDGTRLRKATLNDLETVLGDGTSRGKPRFYRFDMDPQNTYLRLELYPPPDRSYTFDVFYVPALSLDEFLSSSFVSIPVRSWDGFIAVRAAAKAKAKEEADITNEMKEAEMMLERIKNDLIPFDRSEPDVVAQINNSGFDSESLMWEPPELFS